jgi:hypothetical protein
MPFLYPLLLGGGSYLAGLTNTSKEEELAKVEQSKNNSRKWLFILGATVVVAGASIYTIKKLTKK